MVTLQEAPRFRGAICLNKVNGYDIIILKDTYAALGHCLDCVIKFHDRSLAWLVNHSETRL